VEMDRRGIMNTSILALVGPIGAALLAFTISYSVLRTKAFGHLLF